MPRYIDGYVVPVPKNKLDAYRRLARKAGKVWLKHGALEVMESVEDDVKKGRITSFPQAVKLKRGEVVVFSYIVYKSRSHRDRVNKQVMDDPLFAKMDMKDMPFDGMRMVFGGFKPLVHMKAEA